MLGSYGMYIEPPNNIFAIVIRYLPAELYVLLVRLPENLTIIVNNCFYFVYIIPGFIAERLIPGICLDRPKLPKAIGRTNWA